MSTMLAAVATRKVKASSSDTPSLIRPDKASELMRLLEIKRLKKDLEAEEKMLASDLLPIAEAARVEASKAAGECISSVKLNGVTYICHSRYSAISDEEKTKQALALEQQAGVPAGTYFQKKYDISVDPLKLTDDVVGMLIQLGAQFFESLEVTKMFHADRTMKPAVAGLAAGLDIKPTSYFKE